MLSSVRARLTLWYSGILAVALIAFTAGLYLLLAQHHYDRLEAGLRSAVQVTSLSVRHEIEEHNGKMEGEPSLREVLNTMHQTSFPKQGIAVYEGARLVASKPGERGFVPSLEPAPRYRHVSGSTLVPSVQTLYTVVAAESLAETEADLRDLRNILFTTVPAVLLLATCGAYFLVRKSLAPVVEMSSMVERIESSNLDRRLPIGNAHDELGYLAATFNNLLSRLQSAFDQQRHFMADASHELRTPISVARTAAQVTLGNPQRSPEEYRDAMTVIEQQMRRLTRLVEDMFLLARADAGVYSLQRGKFYLDELLLETRRAASVLAEQKGVTIAAGEFPEALCEGDEELMRRLVLILLDNAVKYTNPGGSVSLSLSRQDEVYGISVTDSGPGIPFEARPHIFERFFRADKARTRVSGGSGLGLSIAQWIAETHGGSVRLMKSDASGSVFTVLIPSVPICAPSQPPVAVS